MTNYLGTLAISGSIDISNGDSGTYSGVLGVDLTVALNSSGSGTGNETVNGNIDVHYTYSSGAYGSAEIPLDFSTPSFEVQVGSFQVNEQLPISLPGVEFGVTLNGSVSSNQQSISENLLATASGSYQGYSFSATTTASGFAQVACFVTGTRLATPSGERPVETMRVGDLILTHAGEARPIVWVGYRRIDCGRHPKGKDVCPVHIKAGAFGPGSPSRDLLLSPDHAVFQNGVLIPVRYLIDHVTVVQETVGRIVTYWHVELERHDVILADGLPCETYLDTGNRRAFANGRSQQLNPGLDAGENCEAIWEAAGYAPFRIDGKTANGAVSADLATLFQPEWYLSRCPDVASAGIDALGHYVAWGRKEGRMPCPEIDLIRGLGLVDPGILAFTMADVVIAGVDPVEHFCNVGWRERRRPNTYFDTGWYLDSYDLPAGINPLLHYVLVGENQGQSPSRHFDPAWYRRRYAIGPGASPLAHYLQHRRTGLFSPLPAFDVASHIQKHGRAVLPDRDPYAHFLAFGQSASMDSRQARRPAA